MLASKRPKSFILFAIAIALMFSVSIPAFAAEGTDSATGIEIRLKSGSKQMTVNGQAVAITAPFQKAGTTFVPLSVITKSFGATLQLKDNKIITLKYLTHTITLTLGSNAAWVDGKKVTLAAAPVVLNGVTMVPLRVVEAFGAKVALNGSTKEIVISVAGVSNSDANTPKIGDSFYKWSMNYPTGLVQEYQSSNGNYLSYSDANGDYFLSVSVEAQEAKLAADEALDYLLELAADETIVDKKPVTKGGTVYQRVISKSYDGFYYDQRIAQANGYLYTIVYGKAANSVADLISSSSVLDSFKISFDSSSKSLEDLSRVKDGLIAFEKDNYGISFKLPYNWSEGYDDTEIYYSSDESEQFYLDIYSAKAGDTADTIVARDTARFKETFLYAKEPEVSSTTWNGIPAKLVKYAYSYDNEKWITEYRIVAVNGNYKYVMLFNYYDEDAVSGEENFKQLLDTFMLSFAEVESNFGEFPDPYDTTDRAATVKKTSVSYGYSVTLPKHWTADYSDFESETVQYSDIGLSFLVYVNEYDSMSEYPDILEEQYTSSGEFKLTSKKAVQVAGAEGYLMIFDAVESSTTDGMHIQTYLLEKDGFIYVVQGSLSSANATEFNNKQLAEALASFKFTN